tara:strand:+ start:194 stop:454 length:261 start_codon:yes stop_codon:yes gene_type:complete
MTKYKRQDLIFWSFIFSAVSGLIIMPLWTALDFGLLFPYDGTHITEQKFMGSVIFTLILTFIFFCSTIVAIVHMIIAMYEQHKNSS